ncbi:MAG: cupin domain-containing protein [Sphingobacteriaceae bacterium]|nr:MAG: cupin domain-containing protein [Sphingobacteriaceae bacterium]
MDDIFKSFNQIPTKTIAPGYAAKLIHTATNTLNFLDVKAGSSIGTHSHHHEQLAFVFEGKFELTVNGEARILEPGVFAIIPPSVEHSGTAVTDCKLLDVFTPVREDFKAL